MNEHDLRHIDLGTFIDGVSAIQDQRNRLASVLREWRAMFDGGLASGPLADLRIKTDAALIGLKK